MAGKINSNLTIVLSKTVISFGTQSLAEMIDQSNLRV